MTLLMSDARTATLAALCALYLRSCEINGTDSETGAAVLTFTPPLSPIEQTVYDDLVLMAGSTTTASMTLDKYRSVKPFLDTERAFIALSQSEFIALTQNQRDRMLFDVVSAIIRVQRVMMRDG